MVEHDVEVPTRDGVLLRVNVYAPPGDGAYPVIGELMSAQEGDDVPVQASGETRLTVRGGSGASAARYR